MKVNFEAIKNDKNSSFRILHNNQPVSKLSWAYHYHPEIEIALIKSERGIRHVGFNKSTFQFEDLILIGPNLPHSGFGLYSTDPHEEFVLQFLPEILPEKKYTPEIYIIEDLLERSNYGISFGKETINNVRDYIIEMYQKNGYEKYLLLLKVLGIMAQSKDYELLNNKIMPYSIISKNKKRLQTIFNFVESEYHQDIDIKKVASKVNLTLPAFCNFFKQATQMSFTEYLNRYRIDKACLFLLEDVTITECSFRCGFNYVPYFNKTFKKYINITPSEFIKQNRRL